MSCLAPTLEFMFPSSFISYKLFHVLCVLIWFTSCLCFRCLRSLFWVCLPSCVITFSSLMCDTCVQLSPSPPTSWCPSVLYQIVVFPCVLLSSLLFPRVSLVSPFYLDLWILVYSLKTIASIVFSIKIKLLSFESWFWSPLHVLSLTPLLRSGSSGPPRPSKG